MFANRRSRPAGLRPARERLVSVALGFGDRYPRSSAKIRVSY